MKITFNSPLILSFSFICIVIYILTGYLGLFQSSFILNPNFNSSSFLDYFRLFSHTLGHDSIDHLIGNLSFILLIGPVIEKQYGARLLFIMMLTTGLLTALLHILFFDSGLLGASGIVFMLIILTSMINIKNKEIPITFILIVIIFIGKEIIGSFNVDNISHTSHIIGGVVGAVFGFGLAGKKATKETNAKDILKGL
jgi:membrane associated rhomboid family serine protease